MSKLIICVDGLGYDLITKDNTPFLYNSKKKGNLKRLETLFAFTGIEYSFFTGKAPNENGIWLEFCKKENSLFNNFFLRILSFNKKLRNYFGAILQLLKKRTYIVGLHNIPKDKLKFFDSSIRIGLWKLPFFQERDFSFYKWPFFVTKKQGKEKMKIIFNYEDDEKRLKRLLSIKGVDIYYTQLMSIDKTIHKYGKKSKKTKQTLKKIDKLIEKYIDRFLSENKKGEIFIWSDHGFCNIENYIDLEKILPKRKDYLYFIAGTTAHFWFKNEEIKKEILEKIKKNKIIKILNKNLAKKNKIPLHKKYGDLILYVEKGNYFFPNFYQRTEKEKFKAMHGYPDDKELDGFLMSNKIFKKLKIYGVLKYIK